MNFRNNGLAKFCGFDYNVAIALSKTEFKREKRRKKGFVSVRGKDIIRGL